MKKQIWRETRTEAKKKKRTEEQKMEKKRNKKICKQKW